MKLLNIAGHGLKKNNVFDPGATGLIKQGEHRYYAESFFDHLKKYEPKGHNVHYHTKYNVYDYKNIVELANSFGKSTKVIEWHFDAANNPDANKGHVIVYNGFKPDVLDLRIRDAISKTIGVRYEHRGNKGISGRNNLANCNRCANGGINYRLIELGFGTSPIDSKIMLEQMDLLAKELTEAIYNVEIKEPQQQDSMAGYYVVKKGDTLWKIGKDYGVTVAELKEWNNLDSDLIFPGQSLEVIGSDIPEPAPEPKPTVTLKAKPTNKIKVGDWVRVPANKLYAKGMNKNPAKSKAHSGKVETINYNWLNQLRLLNNDGSYLGFARISDITGGTQKAIRLAVGDRVRVKQGAKTYDNKSLASFIYTNTYNIIQINGDRIVIGKGEAVTAAINRKDLILV